MKSTYFQNYLIVLFIFAIIISALLAHTCIPLVGILGGFILSMVLVRLLCKKWWTPEISEVKKYSISGLVALVGSQMGWVALLI